MLGLAAELGAQLWLLRGDAGGTGVEVALTRHVAAQGNKDRGAEGELVGSEQRSDQDVACGSEAAVGTQTDTAAQTVVDEHLLCLGKTELPWVARVLDAGERRCARAASMPGDDDVIRIRLGYACSDRAHAAFGDKLDADRGARIDALEVIDELGEVFDRIDVVMRRWTDELHAGLGMAQACNQLGDLVTGELAAFAGLGALSDLDLDLFGVNQVFRRDTESRAGHLLDLVVQQRGRAVNRCIDRRVFAALTGVGACAEQVHGLGDGLVRFRRQRAEAHGRGDEILNDAARSFYCLELKFWAGGADFEQVAEVRGLQLAGLRSEGRPWRESKSRALFCRAHRSLQCAHGLRLPGMRLRLIGFTEAHETVVGKILDRSDSSNERAAIFLRSIIARFGSGRLVDLELADLFFDLRKADARKRRGRSEEALVDHFVGQAD